jgi:hypothetical protein
MFDSIEDFGQLINQIFHITVDVFACILVYSHRVQEGYMI